MCCRWLLVFGVSVCLTGCVQHGAAPNVYASSGRFDHIAYGPAAGLGPSASYTIVIGRNGAAKLYGCEMAPFIGLFAGQLTTPNLTSLTDSLGRHDYYRQTKSDLVVDAPGVGLEILVDGERIQRFHSDPVPDDLHELGSVMDRIIHTTRWNGRMADPPYSTLDYRLRKHRLRFFQQLIGCGIPNPYNPIRHLPLGETP